jgi:signal transduction histidine kinase
VRRTEYPPANTEIGEWTRTYGIRYLVFCPIIVEGQVWGMAANMSTRRQPEHTEARMQEFMELLATAIANAHSRAELLASRARVVTASDATRRRIERDLHDGVQQRLVSLGLEMRAAEAAVPPGFKEQLARMAQGLADVLDDLREISRGLHPAILSTNGLRAALKALIRRLAIPVKLEMNLDARLAEPIEVAIYYAVSEALANVLKHANATQAWVNVHADLRAVQVTIADDGIGGADLSGSGLVGLKDRVEALGGRLRMDSPQGQGTTLQIGIPTQAPDTVRTGECR